MPLEEEHQAPALDPSTPPARPLTTRSLMAAADPARRLQELLREQAPPDEAAPEIAPPMDAPPAVPAPPPAVPAPPPAASVPPTPPAEVVRLSITLDGARLDPIEYAGREALPTRAQLEQTHRAYVLRDQWTKADATPVWMVYMRRKTR